MRFDKYVSRASNLFMENRLCKFMTIVLAAVIIIQLWMLNNSFRNQNAYLIPTGLTTKAAVSGHFLDANYVQAMGVYVSQLLYNFTPQTVANQYKELASLFSADCYQENSNKLISMANAYADNEISMVFRVMEIKSFTQPNVIEISGETSKTILGENVQSFKASLLVYYDVFNGLFRITAIEEKQS
ncbi:hypothetical protein Dacet_0553 [Denitrovibrio acetiphilus DSM 12809]|uniref:Type IV conjugative transfer system protein TraE n=1 Tax=Denitrovibrio acetiphilus (strain DSM 12809 / NBRC 114555 / N2460) TaxID=522772 RepID=D4H440_DENA2|nr:TraE/TraK family type IV conjugative transfer system protein [Denitrovibrio acetiphilus]ADD67351.1 hypothetical protein Dacet_0553 [Denitrovibrio acetiphilus DSM 12809]